MKTISLLGCGKLGLPLALDLVDEGYNVKGSTTTESKMYKLKQSGITPYLIIIEECIQIDFFDSDILVLTLPYRKTFSEPNIYQNQIKKVCEIVDNSSIRHIIFIEKVYKHDTTNLVLQFLVKIRF